MIDWDFAIKIFFISILGTFFSMGILTLVIKIIGKFFTYNGHHKEDLKD